MKQANEIKKRIWKQCFLAISWKIVIMLFLAITLARNVEDLALFAAVSIVVISTDLTVNVRMSFQYIDKGVEQFGEKFVLDALNLLARQGDYEVYHKLLLTTYKDGTFER